MASIFKSTMNFSKSLKESVERQDHVENVVLNLLSDSDADDEYKTHLINDAAIDQDTVFNTYSGKAYKLKKALGSSILEISDMSYDVQQEVYLIDLLDCTYDTVIEGVDIPVSEICEQINCGENMNAVIASMSDTFLSSVKVSSSDLYSIIDSYPGIVSEDRAVLKSTIATISDGGKVSNYSFLSAMKSVLESGKESTDDGSLVLQSSAPFKLQSFLNTVLTVIGSIFSVVVTAIGALLGGLVLVLSVVASLVFSLITNMATTKVQIDTESTNEYAQGVFISNSSYQIPTLAFTTLPVGSAAMVHQSLFETFIWKSEGKLNVNSFLNLAYEPELLFDSMCELIDFSGSRLLNREIQFLGRFGDINWDYFALDTEKTMRLHYDEDFLEEHYKKVCILLGACFILLTENYNMGYELYDASGSIHYFTNVMLHAFDYCCDDDGVKIHSFDDYYQIIKSNVTLANCQGFLAEIISNNSSITEVVNNMDQASSYIYDAPGHYAGFEGDYATSLFHRAGLFSLFVGASITPQVRTGFEIWDQLPPTPSVVLPDVSSEKLLLAMGLTAAVVAGLFIAKKCVTARFKARKAAKQSLRSDRLNNSRKEYLEVMEDPESTPIEKQYASQKFKKEVMSYNRKASFFGWEQYDAANGWFDSSSGSVSSCANGLSSLNSLVPNSELLSNDGNMSEELTNVARMISG